MLPSGLNLVADTISGTPNTVQGSPIFPCFFFLGVCVLTTTLYSPSDFYHCGHRQWWQRSREQVMFHSHLSSSRLVLSVVRIGCRRHVLICCRHHGRRPFLHHGAVVWLPAAAAGSFAHRHHHKRHTNQCGKLFFHRLGRHVRKRNCVTGVFHSCHISGMDSFFFLGVGFGFSHFESKNSRFRRVRI